MKHFETVHCKCGATHPGHEGKILVEAGAINRLPEEIAALGCKKPFLVADPNTFRAAGEKAVSLLRENDISHAFYVYPNSPAPDERTVGDAVMHLDRSCDLIVGVGSGVINDVCKLLAHTAALPYIVVATAPSMDGYASATSSMELHGIKTSLNSKCPDVIIGDLDILASAPLRLRLSGLGDMLAKYVSICEWRISNLINGEHYCERVADMIRSALRDCIANADGLLSGDKEAVRAVFEGLATAGIAATYAGTSRPASGVEHYISHVWDMLALEFGTPASTHGYQCAVGTVIAAGIYDKLRTYVPDKARAMEAFAGFRYEDYKEQLHALLGNSSRTMIALEERERKYSPDTFPRRIERIIEVWDQILKAIGEELPVQSEILTLLRKLGAPTTPAELGIDPATLPEVFEATRDIRDKYVLSRLIFDLGLTEEIKKDLYTESV